MKKVLKNIGAFILGILIGGIVNMGIIYLSPYLVPPPEGVDISNVESIANNINKYKPVHFLMPFLAHAIGTLIGACVAAFLAASNKLIYALAVGIFFLFGGIQMVRMLPSPMWFNLVDLTFAYLPMGFLGWLLAYKKIKHA